MNIAIADAKANQLYVDDTPRIAVMSAFEPELKILLNKLENRQIYTFNGTQFNTGKLEGHEVLLMLSGISMVNAAMNTQLLFDKFTISNLIFSGIAGGVNPDLNIGDVTVPKQWGQYLESVFMRDIGDGNFQVPKSKSTANFNNYHMMQPREVRVRSTEKPETHYKFWFTVDNAMYKTAKGLNHIDLKSCDSANNCISEQPRLVVGGNGVSGQVFVDNADFRKYAFDTFKANVLDMESAACAAVAYSNGVPFLAFRSLSDLAGGGTGENEMYAFMNIAAENASTVVIAFLKAWHNYLR